MMEADPEFERFLKGLNAISDFSLVEGGYRVVVELPEPWPLQIPPRPAVISWLKEKQRDIRVLWHVERPPDVDALDATIVRPRKPYTLDEYPRYVAKPDPDAEFEAFCRSMPGVLDVEIGDETYLITIDLQDMHPTRLAVYRWMANYGRHFDTRFTGRSTDRHSRYDRIDRVISTLTYRHRPDQEEAEPGPDQGQTQQNREESPDVA